MCTTTAFVNSNHVSENGKCGRKCCTKRLVNFEELPTVLRFNRYIRSGYRAGYTYYEALLSTFQLHNETGNIWSHLLPAWLLLVGLFSAEESPFPSDLRHVDLLNIFFSVLCFSASVGYHTYMACDHHYHHWLKLDLCGVYSLVVGSQIHVFYFGFPCHPNFAFILSAIYVLFGIYGINYSMQATSPMARGVPLLLLMSIRVALLSLRLWIGSTNMETWRLYSLAELLSFLGGLINACRLPECLFQPSIRKCDNASTYQFGWFDYWCNSHQIMHVLVVIAIFCMRHGLASDCHYSLQHNLCFHQT